MKWKVFETVTEKDTPDGPEKKKTGPVIRSGKPAECVLNFQQCLQGGHKNTNKDNCTCVVNFEIDGGKLKINKPPLSKQHARLRKKLGLKTHEEIPVHLVSNADSSRLRTEKHR